MPDRGDELVLRPKEPKLKKAAKPKSDGSTVRLETAFKAQFTERWGFPPIVSPARDRKLLKTLAEQWGEAAVLEVMRVFFMTTDPQVRRCRFYNVPDFAYWAPRLRLAQQDKGADVHARTAENLHEIAKATGRKP